MHGARSPILPSLRSGEVSAWLVLLAKRNVRAARDVCPIALTDSLGRTVLGLLTQALKSQVLPKILHLPIFAFVPGRGTLQALMFACDGLHRIDRLQTFEAVSSLASTCLKPSTDYLQNCLATGFDWLSVDSTLSQLFLKWLHEATYHFQHRRVPCQILTSQGVRQGCKASPLEWTIFLTLLMCRLDLGMPETCVDWVKKHLLTYADDLLAGKAVSLRWTMKPAFPLQR